MKNGKTSTFFGMVYWEVRDRAEWHLLKHKDFQKHGVTKHGLSDQKASLRALCDITSVSP